jgi:two-component system nitrogen regulation response regulator NtrX
MLLFSLVENVDRILIQIFCRVQRASWKCLRAVGSDISGGVIAATNQDLSREIQEGRFRKDLFFRLGGESLVMPALRDRKEDIPNLVESLMRQVFPGKKLPHLDVSAIAALESYDWPGNVRELKSVIERAVCLAHGGPIQRQHIDAQLGLNSVATHAEWQIPIDPLIDFSAKPWVEAETDFKRRYFQCLAEQCDWDVAQIANRADMHVQSVRKVLRQLGLERPAQDHRTNAQRPNTNDGIV